MAQSNKNTNISPGNENATKANFSALLYLVTEQQVLIGLLIRELLDSGALSIYQIEKVTGFYGDEKLLSSAYASLYKRFAWFYLRTKQILDREIGKVSQPLDDGKEKNDD